MPSRIDNYTIQKFLGSGGQAQVKLASDQEGNQFAIKVFKLTDPDKNEKLLKSLRVETEAYMNLEHPNLVRMFDFRDEAV